MAYTRNHLADRRLKIKANRNRLRIQRRFKPTRTVRKGAVAGDSLIALGGALYNAAGLNGNAVAEVENIGRPAAAVFHTPDSGGVTSVNGRGSACSDGEGGGDPGTDYLLRSGVLAMTGNFDMGGYSIVNVNNVDGYDVSDLGADVTALNSRTVLADSPLLSDEEVFGDGSPTISLDMATLAGDGLAVNGSALDVNAGDGLGIDTDALYVKTDSTLDITADQLGVNLAHDFDWTGDHTFAGSVGANVFDSADPITGWKILANGSAWFSSIEATELTVKSFIADETLALAGSQVVTKSMAILSADVTTPAVDGTEYFYVYDLPGQPATAVFESGDWVRFRYVDRGAGLDVGDVWATVTGYVDQADGTQRWTMTVQDGSSSTIYAGMVVLDYGQSGDGYVELSALGDDTPYVTVRTWVTDPSDSANHTTVARLGKLDGITDAELGSLSGYGLYTTVAELRGHLVAGGGAVHVDDYGIRLDVDTGSSYDPLTTIEWREDASDPDSDLVSWVRTYRAGDSGNVTADLSIGVTETGSNTDHSKISIAAGPSSNLVGISINSYDTLNSNQQTITHFAELHYFNSDMTVDGHVLPATDGTRTLGSDALAWAELHVDELHVATIVGTPDYDHHHNDLYYTETEIDSLLSGKAEAVHTHAQYALVVDLAAHEGDTSAHGVTTVAGLDEVQTFTSKTFDDETAFNANVVIGSGSNAYPLSVEGDASQETGGLFNTLAIQSARPGILQKSVVSGGTQSAIALNELFMDNGTVSAPVFRHGVLAYHNIGTTPALRRYWMSADTGSTPQSSYAFAIDPDNHVEMPEDVEIGGALDVAGTVTGAGSVVGTLYGKFGNALIVGGTDTPAYTLDVRGTASITGDLSAGDATLDSLTTGLIAAPEETDLDIQFDDLYLSASDGSHHWLIGEDGALRSAGDYAFVTGVRGTYISPTGRLEANDVKIRGEFHAAVFSYDSEVLNNGSMRWTPGGAATLAADMTVPAVGESATVRVNDTDFGQFVQFLAGHILRIKGIADVTHTSYTGEAVGFSFDVLPLAVTVPDTSISTVDVWLEVTGHTLYDGYIEYDCDVIKASASGATVRAGAGIASYENPSATDDHLGYIYAVANDGFSPRLEFGYIGDEPWNGDEYPQIVIGRRDGTALITDTDPGILIAPNTTDPDSGYLTVDTDSIYGKNIDSSYADDDGVFLELTSGNGVELRTADYEIVLGSDRTIPADPLELLSRSRLFTMSDSDGAAMLEYGAHRVRQVASGYSDVETIVGGMRMIVPNEYEGGGRFTLGTVRGEDQESWLSFRSGPGLNQISAESTDISLAAAEGIDISAARLVLSGSVVLRNIAKSESDAEVGEIYMDPTTRSLMVKE